MDNHEKKETVTAVILSYLSFVMTLSLDQKSNNSSSKQGRYFLLLANNPDYSAFSRVVIYVYAFVSMWIYGQWLAVYFIEVNKVAYIRI